MTTDVELVERSRRRDSDAFGALVARHQQLVFGVALARCHDPALAEDVAQEAFVTAWRDLDRLRDGTRVGPWLAGIARNLAASAVRTRIRREQIVLEPPADAPTPEDAALEREDSELLHRALAELSDAHRETLVLFYLEGKSIASIAELLGVAEDVVKQRLSRARRALRDTVADRVESVLTRSRLSPGFGAAIAATLATAAARRAAAGKVIFSMTSNKLALAAIALAAAGGAALWLHAGRAATPHASPAPHTTASGSAGSLHVQRLPDRAAHDHLLAQIRDARARRVAAQPALPASPASSWSSSPSSSFGPAPALADDDPDRAYIRAAVQELLPMITECYTHALDRDPKAAGDLVVNFTIEGEPGVGGVVGDSAIDPEQSTLADPDMRECVQETMYGLEIDPPRNGTVHVTYPFHFSS